MSDAFWMTLAANLTALAAVLTVLLRFRRETNKAIAENTSLTKEAKSAATEAKEAVTNGLTAKIDKIDERTNGLTEKLVHVTAVAEFAKGVLAGKAQADEQKAS